MPQRFTSADPLFIGCCNGIVCLTDKRDGVIYLWNPSTKQYKRVPDPPNVFGRIIGFGYDSISNDYKILCLQSYDRVTAHLFSTNGDFWREIDVNITVPAADIYTLGGGGLAINGVLYFENKWGRTMTDQLIAFNLHTEEYDILPLPCPVYDIKSNLLDFEGSLVIIANQYSGLNVWTLENTGEMSWIKKFTIDRSWNINKFLFYPDTLIESYLGNGQFYGSCYRYSTDPSFDINCHMWYNYKNKEGNSFDLQNGKNPLVLKYTESLVSLQGFESTYGYPGRSKKTAIPNGRVGVIIGKRGRTIKYPELQSGAKIQVTRDMDAYPNSATRDVELIGTPEQISKAEQLINDVLNEAESGGSAVVSRRLPGYIELGCSGNYLSGKTEFKFS